MLHSGDAAGAALADAVAWSDPGAGTDATGAAPHAFVTATSAVTAADPAATRELAVVDPRVPDAARLLAELDAQRAAGRPVDVLVLEGDADAIATIGRALADASAPYSALHLFGHGEPGALMLGGMSLDLSTLRARASDVAGWSEGLTADADLLLWGCDSGAGDPGRALVEGLAALTGADVAASEDATGGLRFGGDWALEVAQGAIEAGVPLGAALQVDYAGLLAVGDPTSGSADLQVNTTLPGLQRVSDSGGGRQLATNAAGTTVAVWWDAGTGELWGSRFDAAGTRLGSPFRIDADGNPDRDPAVAIADDGRFAVVWIDATSKVYGRLFDASGNPIGANKFRLDNSGTSGSNLGAPSVAMSGDGRFVAAWAFDTGGGNGRDVGYRAYAADGTPVASAAIASSTRAGSQSGPSVAIAEDGSFAIAFASSDATTSSVLMRRFGASGTPLAPETAIHTAAAGTTLSDLSIARLAAGDHAIAWSSLAGGVGSAWAAVADATSGVRVPAFRVDDGFAGNAENPSVAALAGGGFVIAWETNGDPAGAGWDVRARAYDASANPDGASQRINRYTTGDQRNATVAAVGDSIRVLWDGPSATDPSGGVSMRTVTQWIPGITVQPGGSVVDESGTTSQTVSFRLDAPPSGAVTLTLAISDPTEGRVSASSLVFDAANWNVAQSVTVTGADDLLLDGNRTFQLGVTVASTDARYHGLAIAPIAFTTIDDETANLVVTAPGGTTTTEAGGTTTIAVALSAAPLLPVVLDVASSDPSVATVSTSTLTFTSENWNVAQSVTVTGVDDRIATGDRPYSVRVSVSASQTADAGYLLAPAAQVALTHLDDDVAGLAVALPATPTTTEWGGSVPLSVVLLSQPRADVRITVSASGGESSLVPTTLVFTAANWETPQSVTVAGADDALADGDRLYEVSLETDSADPLYASLPAVPLLLANLDDETPMLDGASSPVLAPGTEDAGAPSGAVGTLVSDLVDLASEDGGLDNVVDPSPDALVGIAVTGADTTVGRWWYTTDGGASWSALGAVSDASARLLAADEDTRLYFEPTADWNGTLSAAITFRAWDRTSGANGTLADATGGGAAGFSSQTDTASLTVDAVDDAPRLATSADALPYAEDAGAVAVDAGLVLSEVDGELLTGATVRIATGYVAGQDALGFADTAGIAGAWDAASGTLTLTGTASVADYEAALRSVTYVNGSQAPVAGERGVTFEARDATLASVEATRRIVVTAVNDAPVAGDASASGQEDAAAIAIVLGGTDVDGTVSGYRLTGLPTGGVLYRDAGRTLSAAAGTVYPTSTGTLTLYFVPAANWNGVATFGYVAIDDAGAVSTNTATATITVAAVNDAPVLNAARAPVLAAQAEDAGAPVGAVGTLVSALADLASQPGGLDNVTDADAGARAGIAVVGADTTNGRWWYTTDGGASWNPLGAVSGANARLLAADADTRLHFESDANWNGTLSNAIRFRAWDGSSGANGDVVAIGATGGVTAFSSATDTASLVVMPVNDAPVLDASRTPSMAPVLEDAGPPGVGDGTAIDDLIDWQDITGQVDNMLDVDARDDGGDARDRRPGAGKGVAIVGADASNGRWWYTTDGGATWRALEVSDTNALLLTVEGSNRLYFQPDPGWNGDIAEAIRFRAWDRAVGGNGTFADASVNGGTTAFSSATDTASLTVIAVNDAPVLNPARTPVLAAQAEDAGAPAGAVGTRVSALVDFASPPGGLDNVTDVDAGARLGIAVIGADTTNGRWWFTTDGGATWSALGDVSDTSARLLAANANTRVYFEPDADWNGTLSAAITFRAWDRNTGIAGGLADASSNGAGTAFSVATDTASLTVTAVNDAPVAGDASASGQEDAAAIAIVLGGTDVDGTVSGYRLTGLPTGGVLYRDAGRTLSAAAGTVYPTSTGTLTLYFVPAADWNGTTTFGYVAIDDAGAVSTNTATATITVAAVNDAPVVTTRGGVQGYVEDDGAVALDPTLVVSDVDGATLEGATLRIAGGYAPGEDVLTYADAGRGIAGTWDAASGTLTLTGTASVAQYEAALRSVGYANASQSPTAGERTVSIEVSDGGLTSAQAIRRIVVMAVNDAPVLDASASPALAAQAEDAGAPVGAAGTPVAALLDAARAFDPDADARLGIAVTGADTTRGTWWFTVDAGATWRPLGGVSDASARLLAADTNTRVYLQSASDWNGTLPSALTFRAWDRTTGANGDLADASVGGGDTAFSSARGVASIVVEPVPDVPRLVVPAGALAAIEDTALRLTAAGGPALSVESADGAATPLRIELSVDRGTLTLADAGRVAFEAGDGVDDARILITGSVEDLAAALASVVYRPAVDDNGAVTLTLSAAPLADPSKAARATVAITIAPVDDAPTIDVAPQAPVPVFATGTTRIGAQLVSASDVDSAPSEIVYTVEQSPAAGRLVLDGVALGVGDRFTQADVDAGRLAFVAGVAGGPQSVVLSVADSTGASAGGRVTVKFAVELPGGASTAQSMPASGAVPAPRAGSPAPAGEASDDGAALAGGSGESAAARAMLLFAPGARSGATGASAGASGGNESWAVPRGGADGAGLAREVAWLGASVPTHGERAGAAARPDAAPDGRSAGEVARWTPETRAVAAQAWSPLAALRQTDLVRDLEQVRERTAAQFEVREAVVASSMAVTASLSVGYVIWVLRGGVLLTSLLASMPAWRSIDPVPVLARIDARGRHDEKDSLRGILRRAAQRRVEAAAAYARQPAATRDPSGAAASATRPTAAEAA